MGENIGGSEKGSGVPGIAAVRDGGIDVRGTSADDEVIGHIELGGEMIEVTRAHEREAREAAMIGNALKLLEKDMTEAADLLSKARTALEDPGELPDEEYEPFVDGHALADNEEDALLQVSRRYAIAKIDEALNAVRLAGAKT